MVQNDCHFTVHFEITIFGALRPMEMDSVGFSMMLNSNLTFPHRLHDSVIQNGLRFTVDFAIIISRSLKPINLGIIYGQIIVDLLN